MDYTGVSLVAQLVKNPSAMLERPGFDLLGSWNRKKESRIVVAKRLGREKPDKKEQRKV